MNDTICLEALREIDSQCNKVKTEIMGAYIYAKCKIAI